MNMDYFVNLLPQNIGKITNIVAHILIIFFLAVVTYYGIGLVIMTHKQLSSGMRIPMSYVYLSIPIGSMFMIMFIVESYFTKKL